LHQIPAPDVRSTIRIDCSTMLHRVSAPTHQKGEMLTDGRFGQQIFAGYTKWTGRNLTFSIRIALVV
jgi:hypothetical protein